MTIDKWKIAQVLVTVCGISVGQLLMKLAANSLGNPRVPGIWLQGYNINVYLVLGVATLGLSTLVWVWVLRTLPLNIAYPFMALCFVIVPALSYVVLGEPLGWKTLAGTVLIVAGVAIISA